MALPESLVPYNSAPKHSEGVVGLEALGLSISFIRFGTQTTHCSWTILISFCLSICLRATERGDVWATEKFLTIWFDLWTTFSCENQLNRKFCRLLEQVGSGSSCPNQILSLRAGPWRNFLDNEGAEKRNRFNGPVQIPGVGTAKQWNFIRKAVSERPSDPPDCNGN